MNFPEAPGFTIPKQFFELSNSIRKLVILWYVIPPMMIANPDEKLYLNNVQGHYSKMGRPKINKFEIIKSSIILDNLILILKQFVENYEKMVRAM